jgi:O-antigen ligase
MKNTVGIIILFCFLAIGFIGNYGAIDRVAFQYVILVLLNCFSFIYFIIIPKRFDVKSELYKNKPLLVYSILFIWSLLSILYSINRTESLISVIRLLIILLSAINISLLIKQINNIKIILVMLAPILLIEIFLPFNVLMNYISSNLGFDFSKSGYLKTFTPNKNITAAIIACHLCFVFVFDHFFKKGRIFFIILTIIASINIVMLSSRATILGILLSFLLIYFLTWLSGVKYFKEITIYFLSFVFGLISSNIYLGADNSASLNNRLTSLDTDDTSTNERLAYYSHGIKHILNNPIKGIGIGNWKQKSIEYNRKNIKSYIVPYHLHNDFLQYATELGILGMVLYAFIFLKLLLINFKRLKINFFLSITLIMTASVLFIDSNLNFPHHRPIMMILFSLLIGLTHFNKNSQFEK